MPVATAASSSDALAAGRELHRELNERFADTPVGIGISAGTVVAGNIGGPQRYEYTVIGDPVNEAARLTEYAKERNGVVASGAVVDDATPAEAGNWTLVDTQTLRGRAADTRIYVPC